MRYLLSDSRSPRRVALAGVAALGLAATLGACSSSDSDSSASPSASAGGDGETSLTITVNNKERTDEWTVTCNPDGGTHPDPNQVCNFLDLSKQWGKDPFAPVGDDQICS